MSLILFNERNYSVTYRSETVLLLPKEFALLRFLYFHQGQSFSREHLLNHVWSMEEPTDRTVDDHIYRLRKKLKPFENILDIKTIRNYGYSLSVNEPARFQKPSLLDRELTQQANLMLTKYHLFGQGESLRTMIEHHEQLGIEPDPFYKMYIKFVYGQFEELIEGQEFSYIHKFFYMLLLYSLIDFHAERCLSLFNYVLERCLLTEENHLEMKILNRIYVLAVAGEFSEAFADLRYSKSIIKQQNLESFIIPVATAEIFVCLMAGETKKIETKIAKIEKLLDASPYLREKGTFLVVKGLWFILSGNRNQGETIIDEGMEVLRQSHFSFMVIFAVHLVLVILRKWETDSDLMEKYETIWTQMAQQYQFQRLKSKIEKEISAHYPDLL